MSDILWTLFVLFIIVFVKCLAFLAACATMYGVCTSIEKLVARLRSRGKGHWTYEFKPAKVAS